MLYRSLAFLFNSSVRIVISFMDLVLDLGTETKMGVLSYNQEQEADVPRLLYLVQVLPPIACGKITALV